MSRKRSHSSSSSDSTTSSSSNSSDGNDRKRKRDRSNSKTRQQESARKYDSSGPNDRGSLHRRETKDLQCLSSENKPLRRSESSSSSSSESDDARQKRKERKKLKKEKKRRKKELKKEKKRLKKEEKKSKKLAKKAKKLLQKSQDLKIPPTVSEPVPGPAPGPPIPELSDRAKAMKPMTKEEWDKRQQVVRKVYDEETGRHRLIKGDGEVLEEIVSRDRHKEINRQATRGDGAFFQSHLAGKIPR